MCHGVHNIMFIGGAVQHAELKNSMLSLQMFQSAVVLVP